MDIECCGREMVEIESSFLNNRGENEVVGYECLVCGNQIDKNGSVIV